MYEHAKSLGISLITISLRYVRAHPLLSIRTSNINGRPLLAKFHTHLLTLVGDGTGRWTFTPIAASPIPGEPGASDSGETTFSGTPACPTTPGGGPAAGDLIRVLEEIRTVERRLEEATVREARVKELEEALQVREGQER